MKENNFYVWNMPDGMVKNYFKLQKFFLKFNGIAVEDKEESFLYRIWSTFMISNYFLMHLILEPYEAYMNLHNYQALVNLLMYLLTDILGNLKIMVLYYNRKKIGKMLQMIESGVFLPDVKRGGEIEIKWMMDIILIINRQTLVYVVTAFTTIFTGLISTLYKRIKYAETPEKWEYPYVTFEHVAGYKSPNWEIGMMYQFLTRTCLAITLFGIDGIMPGMLAIISVQFKLLQNSLRRLVHNTYIEYNVLHNPNFDANNVVMEYSTSMRSAEVPFEIRSIPKQFLFNKLKTVVKYHLDILRVTEEMEELFNLLVLTVFLSTLFILCFTMFHASMYPLLSAWVFQDLCYLSFILTQVFCYCYWGNEVTLESQGVAQAAFDSHFQGSDPPYQKALSLMMQRSQRPVIMTAGKFANLSITTFVTMMRASYSYYMVLRRNGH